MLNVIAFFTKIRKMASFSLTELSPLPKLNIRLKQCCSFRDTLVGNKMDLYHYTNLVRSHRRSSNLGVRDRRTRSCETLGRNFKQIGAILFYRFCLAEADTKIDAF